MNSVPLPSEAEPSPRPRRGVPRREQAEATRTVLLRTAERLFAERGLAEVSNRQIVEAAGQANNSALTYHVGTRVDLIRAIVRSHAESLSGRTQELVEQVRGRVEAREHVASLVLPFTEHLAQLGNPSWFARFLTQLAADPVFSADVHVEILLAPSYQEGLAAVWSHLPELPPQEAALRGQMAWYAIVHTCADQERTADASGAPADWAQVGEAVIDAVTGLLLAPRYGPPAPQATPAPGRTAAAEPRA